MRSKSANLVVVIADPAYPDYNDPFESGGSSVFGVQGCVEAQAAGVSGS
jgi:hypothetical protein